MPTTQLPIPSSTELRTIQKIRDADQRSTSPLLDRKILDEDSLSKLGDAFQLPIPSHYGYPNVPLKHVFSLGRQNDAWMEGDTWRDVPIKRLHGNGWTDCVFEYFENEIGDKQFDAPGATDTLQLTS